MKSIISKKIPLPQEYHNFADKRSLLGIPNFLDVMSNLAILIPGLYLLRTRKKVSLMSNLLILHITLLAITSAYYHLFPSHKTIFGDILSIATLSIIVIIIATPNSSDHTESNSPVVPWWKESHNYIYGILLYLFGIFSIVYWKYTGDLKFYVLILVGAPLYVIYRYYNKSNVRQYLIMMIVSNILLRLSENNDRYIYKMTKNLVSGHTLKHVFVGTGLFYLIKILETDNKL